MGNEDRRRIDTWAEEDVHTPWRRVYCYLKNHSGSAKVKLATRRRERRKGKAEIREPREALPARGPGRNRACKASPDGKHVMQEVGRKPCTVKLFDDDEPGDFVYWECAHGCGKTDMTMEAAP